MVGTDPFVVAGLKKTVRSWLPGGRVFDAIFALLLSAASRDGIAAG